MSGTPQKMLEHLLETRLSGQVGPNDPFLDDFLLTHIVFMPVPMLIDELANLYPFSMYTNFIYSIVLYIAKSFDLHLLDIYYVMYIIYTHSCYVAGPKINWKI